MLLTTEVVADEQMAATILRWYYYRWLILSLIAYILAHWAYLSTHSKDLPN
ncbi:hypothetical protein [Nostoc sp.]|uniref:hypothetical protein n=1 Tax=Nostoc sp. TaxID=1180 RepID=UPI002FF4C309